ncbi:MAG: 50S ribosomal protein L31 [bacterium]
MKKGIHPQLFKNAKVHDLSSGKSFILASTKEEISLEVTNLTHPFYTGKQKIVDTENLVKKFEHKRTNKNTDAVQRKKDKRLRRSQKTTAVNSGSKLTLKDMLNSMK